MLPAHQLRFHKVSRKDGSAKCDAFHTGQPDDAIIGVLYEIPEAAKHDLDPFEGVGYGYEVRRVQVILPNDTHVDAVAYAARHIESVVAIDDQDTKGSGRARQAAFLIAF